MTSMFGGSSPSQLGVPPPQTFQYAGMGDAASGTLGDVSSLTDLFKGNQNILGQLGSTAQGLIGSPYAQSGITSALGAMGPAGAVANAGIGLGGNLIGAAGGLMPAISAMLGQAFDPQGALYSRTAGQVQDQTLSNLANAGVATTPYGQGVLGNTMGNFNIDWQNNLLQRMLSGLGGAGGALGAMGNVGGMGEQLGAGGATNAVQAGLLPYSVEQGIGGQNMGLLQTLLGAGNTAMQPLQSGISDLLSYLTGGTQANSAANAANLGLGQLAANQQQQQYSNIGSAASGLGSMFGASGMFGKGLGGGAFSGAPAALGNMLK
jgi:hypothetical protein